MVLEQNFNSRSYDFFRDATFTIFERIEKIRQHIRKYYSDD